MITMTSMTEFYPFFGEAALLQFQPLGIHLSLRLKITGPERYIEQKI